MFTYKYLIFDVDDTLLNFYHAFRTAQINIAQKLNVEYSNYYISLDEKCSWQAWKKFDLDNTEDENIQKNYHTIYYQYLREHFNNLLEALGISSTAEYLVDCYLESLSSSSELMEKNTLCIYITLSQRYSLALATNGLEKVQQKRLTAFLPYTYRLYISESIGYVKPSTQYYEYILNDLKCSSNTCLMIGDSITNDMIGAKSMGMDVCFYNNKSQKKPHDLYIDYEINHIQDLLHILF